VVPFSSAVVGNFHSALDTYEHYDRRLLRGRSDFRLYERKRAVPDIRTSATDLARFEH
jgi:hypothetical protein